MDHGPFRDAVRESWRVRELQARRQTESGKTDAGKRGSVTGGGHLAPLERVVADLFISAGFPPDAIRLSRGLELPGYYRPTKKWDLLVVDEGRLVAAIELKSQGSSFGNNFNNRIEEAIGSAVDIWRSYEEGQFGKLRPWLGYVFLLAETAESTSPVGVSSPVFPADPIFHGASYLDRYRILCQRLVRERLYDAACLVVSSGAPELDIYEPEPELGFANFAAAIAGRAAYVRALSNLG